MLKKIFYPLAISGVLTTPVLAVSSVEEKAKHLTIVYDNKYFGSYEDVMKYYLKKYPHAIENENVIGDVANAIIDYDYNILNRNILNVYDQNLIYPVYLKHSGEYTSSFYEAQKSFANPIFIREKYQGVAGTFSTAEEAKMDRQNNMLDLYQGFYLMPDLFLKDNLSKFNPLSEADYTKFTNSIVDGIKNNQKFNTYDYQKIIENSENTEGLLPVLKDSEWSFLELSSQDLENKNFTWPEKWPTGKDEKLNQEYLKQEYIHNIEDEKLDSIEKHSGSDDEMKGRGEAFIRVYPFQNSFENPKDAKYWEFRGDSFNGTELGGRDDSTYTNVSFIDIGGHKNFETEIIIDNQVELDKILTKNNSSSQINVATRLKREDQDGYFNEYDLNNSKNWNNFREEAQNRISYLRNFFGENLKYELKVSLNERAKKEKDSTNFIKHYWEDRYGLKDSKNVHYLKNMNINYFDFTLSFKFQPNENDILINTYQKFNDYYKYRVNIQGEDWSLNIYDLLMKWLDNPSIIENGAPILVMPDKYEKSILTKIKKEIEETEIEKLKEIIKIKSDNNSMIALFDLNRNDNFNTKMINNINLSKLKKDIFNDLDELNDFGLSEIFIDNFSLEEILNKLIDFIIYDGNETNNDWNSYNALINQESEGLTYTKALKALSDLDKLKTPIVLGTKDLFDANYQKLPSIINIFQGLLNDLYLYLNHFQNHNASEDLDFWKDFLTNNTFVKKTRINFNQVLILSNDKNKLENISKVPIGQGQYLLLQENLFNSGLLETNSQNLGPDGLFLDKNTYAGYRSAIINAKPPVVRIMYNLDGEKVIGDNELIYDSEDVLLSNVQNQVHVKVDPYYVYYGKGKNQRLVLNQKANIYTINHMNKYGKFKKRSFLNFTSAYNYLLEMLKQEMIIIQ